MFSQESEYELIYGKPRAGILPSWVRLLTCVVGGVLLHIFGLNPNISGNVYHSLLVWILDEICLASWLDHRILLASVTKRALGVLF